jgi:hypothetical protein
MKRFLAIYTGSAAAISKWNSMPERELQERQAAGIKAWHAWVERNKASIIEVGAPLGRTKSISAGGIADIRNNMTAFTLVQADSQEAAAKLFENHPHFTVFPGDAVEVMECLPVPAM